MLRHLLRLTFLSAAFAAIALVGNSCERIDDTRIPAVQVGLTFRGQQTWDVYGVHGALDSKRFIKELNEPAGFYYVVSDCTGFGGLLLVCDFYGNPVVYDLSCPVEQRRDVRVFVNSDNEAECPVCHSTYAVFENYGMPLSGRAAENQWGLKKYRIGRNGSDYVITR